jgi:hypothetical protein
VRGLIPRIRTVSPIAKCLAARFHNGASEGGLAPKEAQTSTGITPWMSTYANGDTRYGSWWVARKDGPTNTGFGLSVLTSSNSDGAQDARLWASRSTPRSLHEIH